jgi:aminomethyltransferase
MSQTDLKKTALYGAHVSLGATMIELDGYTLPGHYPINGVMETRRKYHAAKTESDGKWTRIVREEFTEISKFPSLLYIAPFFGPDCGTIVEHRFVRFECGISDISHMGQIIVSGSGAERLLEIVTPSQFHFPNRRDIHDYLYRSQYTVLLNKNGGIVDSLIVTRVSKDKFYLITSASRKSIDLKLLHKFAGEDIKIEDMENKSLIAIQGPKATGIASEILQLDSSHPLYHDFYRYRRGFIFEHSIFGKMFVSNMGLTGELGYIVAVDNNYVVNLWNSFVRDRGDVRPVGLEAIDTLRTEAYYPLYGQDINEINTPVEAGFNWSVRMDLRGSEHEHDHSIKCLGADIIKDQINNGTKRERFGIKVLGEGIIRPGLELFYLNQATNDYIPVGAVTSGCFTPSIVDYNDPEMSLVLDAQNPFGFLEEIENNLKSKDPGTRISALTKIESFPSFSVGQGYVNLDKGFNITFGSIIYCKIDNNMRPVLLTRLLFHGSRAWLIYKR